MKWPMVMVCVVILSGCESKLATQAVKEAKESFEEKSYQHAVGLLKLASDESSDEKYKHWYEQGEAFLKMIQYSDLESFDELLLAWTDLNLVDSQPSFIKEEAIAYIKERLSEVKVLADEALQSGDTKEAIQFIRLEAVKEAKESFEEKSYQHAVGLLKLASDESSDEKYKHWYEQGEAFLKMIQYSDLESFDELLLAWTDLNLVDSQPSFIKEEAIAYIKERLSEVKVLADEALQSGDTKEAIQFIRLVEKRMGTLEVFKEEIEELIELKQEMEGQDERSNT